jgi:hypothetical protein
MNVAGSLALASADLALSLTVLMIVCYSSDDSALQRLAAYHWHWVPNSHWASLMVLLIVRYSEDDDGY